MKDSTEMGMNKTGMGMAPRLSDRMREIPRQTRPSKGNGDAIARTRADYCDVSHPIGSTPPPASVKGAAKAGLAALKGKKANVFINKLGERLAYERTGVRLYEALLAKCSEESSWDGGPTRERLQHFRSEELSHFQTVREAIESLGGDPTAVTPAADVTGVASEGMVKVITDPRTSLSESLDALLGVELVDNAAWESLIQLAQDLGQDQQAGRFEKALKEEQEHLQSVRAWLSSDMKQKAQIG